GDNGWRPGARYAPQAAPVAPADSLRPGPAPAHATPPLHGCSNESRPDDSAPAESPIPAWPQSLPCLPPANRPRAIVPTDVNSCPLPQTVSPHPDHPEISCSPRASHPDILPPLRVNPISGPPEIAWPAPQCTPDRSPTLPPIGLPPSRWLDAPA